MALLTAEYWAAEKAHSTAAATVWSMAAWRAPSMVEAMARLSAVAKVSYLVVTMDVSMVAWMAAATAVSTAASSAGLKAAY